MPACEVHHLLDGREDAPALVLVNPLGGNLHVWEKQHAPERVQQLVVCFSSDRFGPPQDWLQRAALVRDQGTAVVAEAVVGRWFTAATAQAQPQLIERMRGMVSATPAEGYASACEAIAGLELSEELAAITAPTLVLSGSDDPATPPEHGRRIAGAIPGARFREIPNAAHLGNFERPEPVNAAILEHLSQPTSRR